MSIRGSIRRHPMWAITGGTALALGAIWYGYRYGGSDAVVKPTAEATPAAASPGREEARSDGTVSTIDELRQDAELSPDATSIERADAGLRLSPSQLQNELVEQVRMESIADLVANLGSLDDEMMAGADLTGMGGASMDASYQNLLVTRLIRVRRLLEESRTEHDRVVEALRAAMTDAVTAWPKVSAEFQKAFHGTGAVRVTDAHPWVQCRGRIRGATYLLADIGDVDSLPLLLRSCKGPEWPRPAGIAIPPATTLYAMHRLVQSYPEGRLSDDARVLRTEYLAAASCLPEPKVLTVTAWNARYAETDPRIALMNPSGSILSGERTIKVEVFPHEYADGTLIGEGDEVVPQRTQELFAKMERFIRAAYPESAQQEQANGQ